MARRSGGRAARVAMRQAPLAEDARAVRPGMSGGAYQPLSNAQMHEVLEAALRLLEDLGMGDPTPELTDLVVTAGGRVDDRGRLRFPADVVRAAIDSAAKEFTIHGFNADDGIEVGGDRVHFATR